MKFENFKRPMLSAGFAFGLFASQQSFILTAPDNSVVGQGTIEETYDTVAQAKMTVQGREFTGTGIITIKPTKQTPGARSDRAFLGSFGKKRMKHAQIFMVAKDGAKLACALDILGSEIEGKCINPDNQQNLAIKTPPEERQ